MQSNNKPVENAVRTILLGVNSVHLYLRKTSKTEMSDVSQT